MIFVLHFFIHRYVYWYLLCRHSPVKIESKESEQIILRMHCSQKKNNKKSNNKRLITISVRQVLRKIKKRMYYTILKKCSTNKRNSLDPFQTFDNTTLLLDLKNIFLDIYG